MRLRNVPTFMKGTLYEETNLENDSPFLVSGWGLVVNLNGTGGSDQISNNLKAFMGKQLEAKGFGRKVSPELKTITPERVLSDKNVAVVGVYGLLPPGIRKGQFQEVGGSVLWTLNPNFDIRLAGNVAIPMGGYIDLAHLANCNSPGGGGAYATGARCGGTDPALRGELRFRARF